MSEKKIWVETIIDAFDLETTKEIDTESGGIWHRLDQRRYQ